MRWRLAEKIECVKTLLFNSITAWIDHRGGSKGAALAFYALFSLAPILILAIAVAGYFFGTSTAQAGLINEIRLITGVKGADVVESLLKSASNSNEGFVATLIATVIMLVGATTVFIELKASLDEIWQNEVKPTKNQAVVAKISVINLMIKTRLLAFGLVLVLGLLLLITLVVSAMLGLLQTYLSNLFQPVGFFFSFLSYTLPFVVIAILFAIIFKMLPNTPLSWRDVTSGAIFTAILFSIGKFVIGLYLGNSTILSGFGAAGSLVALLLWIYYSSQIFFFGAEFTRQYALLHGSMKT